MADEPNDEAKREGVPVSPSGRTPAEPKKLFWPVWWLVFYAFSVDGYVNESRDVWRTLAQVVLTLIVLRLSGAPLARALHEWWNVKRGHGRDDGQGTPGSG